MQLVSPCVCSSKTRTKLVVLALSVWRLVGILKPDMVVTFALANVTNEIKSAEIHHEVLSEALPGDNMGFDVKKCVCQNCFCGNLADSNNVPPMEADAF